LATRPYLGPSPIFDGAAKVEEHSSGPLFFNKLAAENWTILDFLPARQFSDKILARILGNFLSLRHHPGGFRA